MERMTLSIKEAADIVGVGEVLMRRLAKEPGFPVFRVGRRVLLSREGLKAWIERQTEEQG